MPFRRPSLLFSIAALGAVLLLACTSSAPAALPAPAAPAMASGSSPSKPLAIAARPLAPMLVERAFPLLAFEQIVQLVAPDDGTGRLFLVLRRGQIVTFPDSETTKDYSLFLDIRDRVNAEGEEEGLLGLAFDPEFAWNHRFYVYYTAANPRRSVLSRFTTNPRDPNRGDPRSEVVLLEVPQPAPNHNGGGLLFGPDGYLYLGLGDGGTVDAQGDPWGNAQNKGTLLGSILRLDVRQPGVSTYGIPPDNPFVGDREARPEIWAYGLRNPWRFSFDRLTGDLWVADVGHARYEEVDLVRPGRNYGWNIMEGFNCFPWGLAECDTRGLELPILEYTHDEGCAITGGYVYRGSQHPSLYGAYIYGDFCSGNIWGLRYDGSRVTEHRLLVTSGLLISSFTETRDGRLYILSYDGKIYRLAPAVVQTEMPVGVADRLAGLGPGLNFQEGPMEAHLGRGWYPLEVPGPYAFRWTEGEAVAYFRAPGAKALYLSAQYTLDEGQVLTIRVNGNDVARLTLGKGPLQARLTLPFTIDTYAEVELLLEWTFTPGNGDERTLGMMVRELRLEPGPE